MGNGPSREEVEREVERLRHAVKIIKTSKLGKPMKLKILVFGPSGMGKSAFCNGIVAAIEDRHIIPNIFPVGSLADSMTLMFHWHVFGNKTLIDMPGIYETKAITDENIKEVAEGKISFYAKITKDLKRREGDAELPVPEDNDVSCVVIVLSLGAEVASEIKRQIQCIMRLAGEGAVSYHLVLTHADEVDKKFKDCEKLPKLLTSSGVQKAIEKVSGATGVPPAYISVVRNYIKESSTDVYSTLLFLRAFEKIVISAEDQANKTERRRIGLHDC